MKPKSVVFKSAGAVRTSFYRIASLHFPGDTGGPRRSHNVLGIAMVIASCHVLPLAQGDIIANHPGTAPPTTPGYRTPISSVSATDPHFIDPRAQGNRVYDTFRLSPLSFPAGADITHFNWEMSVGNGADDPGPLMVTSYRVEFWENQVSPGVRGQPGRALFSVDIPAAAVQYDYKGVSLLPGADGGINYAFYHVSVNLPESFHAVTDTSYWVSWVAMTPTFWPAYTWFGTPSGGESWQDRVDGDLDLVLRIDRAGQYSLFWSLEGTATPPNVVLVDHSYSSPPPNDSYTIWQSSFSATDSDPATGRQGNRVYDIFKLPLATFPLGADVRTVNWEMSVSHRDNLENNPPGPLMATSYRVNFWANQKLPGQRDQPGEKLFTLDLPAAAVRSTFVGLSSESFNAPCCVNFAYYHMSVDLPQPFHAAPNTSYWVSWMAFTPTFQPIYEGYFTVTGGQVWQDRLDQDGNLMARLDRSGITMVYSLEGTATPETLFNQSSPFPSHAPVWRSNFTAGPSPLVINNQTVQGARAYEDFRLDYDASITRVRWQMAIGDDDVPGNNPPGAFPIDSWEMALWGNQAEGHQPGNQLSLLTLASGSVRRSLLGIINNPGSVADKWAVYDFETDLAAPIGVDKGTTYWLSIMATTPTWNPSISWVGATTIGSSIQDALSSQHGLIERFIRTNDFAFTLAGLKRIPPLSPTGSITQTGTNVSITAGLTRSDGSPAQPADWKLEYYKPSLNDGIRAGVYFAFNPGTLGAIDAIIASQEPVSALIANPHWSDPGRGFGYPQGFMDATGQFQGNQENFFVNHLGQIYIPPRAERSDPTADVIRFKDGVDDYCYLEIDGDPLINDNIWTDQTGSENGGSPIAAFNVTSARFDDGEWVPFRFVAAEGEGGDSAILWWDAFDTDGNFPQAAGDPADHGDLVPDGNFHVAGMEKIKEVSGTGTPVNQSVDPLPAGAVQLRLIVEGTEVRRLDVDRDGDGMTDIFEVAHGLDPANPADGTLDKDGDGLSNAAEAGQGTDPSVTDSDGDGLADGAEVATHHTNPTNADEDNDSLNDGGELAAGTDPRNPDTDGDGARDGLEVRRGFNPLNPNSLPSVVRAGGLFTVTHVWTQGTPQMSDAATAEEITAGDSDVGQRITVESQSIHFHDNVPPPEFADLSLPYPLWGADGDNSGFGNREDFAIRAVGQINIVQGGTISFLCNSDDGFVLKIDGTTVGEAGLRARENTLMEVELTAGLHDLEFLHWERGDGAGVSLFVFRETGPAPALNADDWELLRAAGGGQPFLITGVDYLMGTAGNSDRVQLTWSSKAGASYAVDVSSDLRLWEPKMAGIESAGSATSFLLLLATPAPAQLHVRIREE